MSLIAPATDGRWSYACCALANDAPPKYLPSGPDTPSTERICPTTRPVAPSGAGIANRTPALMMSLATCAIVPAGMNWVTNPPTVPGRPVRADHAAASAVAFHAVGFRILACAYCSNSAAVSAGERSTPPAHVAALTGASTPRVMFSAVLPVAVSPRDRSRDAQ